MSTLQERLDRMKEGSAKQMPPEAKAIMSAATEELAASGIMDRIPRVGDALPSFALANHDGATVRSEELLARGPLVMTFYRGLW